jgi:glutaredoxin
MEKKEFMIVVYGKDNCPHCKELQKTVTEVLQHSEPIFFADYQNLSKMEGLVVYAKAETINGQRIPALQIMKWNRKTDCYEKIIDPRKPLKNKNQGIEYMPTYLQLQTDYANHHYITQDDILDLLDIAKKTV